MMALDEIPFGIVGKCFGMTVTERMQNTEMDKMSLNGKWQMQILGDNVFGITNEPIPVQIPGSVYGNLLNQNLISDPYYRMNELDALKLMENDFLFTTTFTLTQEQLESDFLLLRMEGIDTLADVYVNDIYLGHAENMHRIWEFALEDAARAGENELRVKIFSPTRYIREENEKVFTGGSTDSMKGFPHLRKAHCMFGWDWGPRLPDAGIFREVSVLYGKKARLEQVCVTQRWTSDQEEVQLHYDVTIEDFVSGMGQETAYEIRTALYDEQDKLLEQRSSLEEEGWDEIKVENPKRWWPHGYGEQTLYRAEAVLFDEQGRKLDEWTRRIGLRTLTVNTRKDEWGECFAHEVNGVKIFAMGADYIPEDNILSRVTKERTQKLLRDAVAANHNCIRVWGGGYYPEDWFFDACDELGLIVWQDFMFACASYELDDDFERNISAEIRDNVRRIRHHASLGLWCGNNEMETQTLDKAWKPSIKQKYDYIKIFEYVIPKILEQEDPSTFYWPSSPSSGGNFDNPWDENRGDTHYWAVWHGDKPFTEYRKFYFRYLSEFGFQSFPSIKTVETFTLPEDRNIFSRVMEMHQRNTAANGKILNYLSATYLYPKNFEMLLYASQLLQADAIRYGIEHFRRHRGRCMGTIVWQLNDIWPVASWSSIDYYGRWKALHYAEKRAFAPVMISCEEIGELSERPFCVAEPESIKKSARLHVANETRNAVSGSVRWSIRNAASEILETGEQEICVEALSGTWIPELDLNEYDEREIYISYAFLQEEQVISENTSLLTPPKHYPFRNPELSLRREENELVVTAKNYAKNVSIEGVDGDVKLSDNFFDMNAGEKRIQILEGNAKEFRLLSVYDIA